MALYTFTTNLLSAALVGTPTPTGTSLSANGVGVVSISSTHTGVAFNAVSGSLTDRYTTIRIYGSVINIDTAYTGTPFALIAPDRSYTVFTYQSAIAAPPLSAISYTSTKDVSTPDQRRKWVLGYF